MTRWKERIIGFVALIISVLIAVVGVGTKNDLLSYVGLFLIVVSFIYSIIKSQCPYCKGFLRSIFYSHCPHCGKKLEE